MATPGGIHCLWELSGCPRDLLDDEATLRRCASEAVARAGATLLELTSHRFRPMGVTVVALLSESHLSIHTWPETGFAAVDVFTCGEKTDPRAACQYLAESLRAERCRSQSITRRIESPVEGRSG
jgi:S-adenosylmethionine decarboxylase